MLIEIVGGVKHVPLEAAKFSDIVEDAESIFPQIFFRQVKGGAYLIIIVGSLKAVIIVLSQRGLFENAFKAGAIKTVGNEGAQHPFQEEPTFVGLPAAEFVGKFV